MSKSHQINMTGVKIHISDHHRQVAVVRSVEAVQRKCPNLNNDDAWEVLRRCIQLNNKYGYSWLPVEIVADELFPMAEEC